MNRNSESVNDEDLTPESENVPLSKIVEMTDEEVRFELFDLLQTEGLDNERKVMLHMVRRYFVLGANCYRALQFNDGRDSVEEAMQEGADYLFYTAKKVLESEQK